MGMKFIHEDAKTQEELWREYVNELCFGTEPIPQSNEEKEDM